MKKLWSESTSATLPTSTTCSKTFGTGRSGGAKREQFSSSTLGRRSSCRFWATLTTTVSMFGMVAEINAMKFEIYCMRLWFDVTGLSLLNKAANDLKRLATESHCVVLVVNHVSGWQTGNATPALGRYWLHVPHLRLYSQRLDDGAFQLTVAHNVYGPAGDKCRFQLPASSRRTWPFQSLTNARDLYKI